ncbi:MAG: hypothetical protein KJ884_16715, partial [Gammaproteobacteria bacterium]|nr:hypothetical protein [Gammaproteobacteria bacterium]
MKLVDILVKVDYQVGEHPDSAMLGVIFRALNFVLRNYPDVEVPIIFEAKYLKTFTSMLGRIESAKSSENFPIANVHLLYCLTYLLLDELRIFTDIENNPIVEFLTWRVRLDGPHSQLLLQQELDVVKKTIENAKVVADYDSVRSYTVEVGKFESNLKNIVELNLEAKRLEDAMKKYRDAFNFAGLYQGFSQLRSRKTIEKNLRLIFLFFLGGLALTPLGLKLLSLHEAGLGEAKKEASWEQLTGLVSGNIELLLTLAALELLVIYFFRITL